MLFEFSKIISLKKLCAYHFFILDRIYIYIYIFNFEDKNKNSMDTTANLVSKKYLLLLFFSI